MFTKEERDVFAYEARLKFQRDQANLLLDARERGFEAGFAQGRLIGQVQHCQGLLKQSQTPLAELAALSQEALAALLAQLRKQLLPNGAGGPAH